MSQRIGKKTFKTKKGHVKRFKSTIKRNRFARVSEKLERKARR